VIPATPRANHTLKGQRTLPPRRQLRQMATADLQNSFQILIEEHKRILYKVCNAYCNHPDSREDLAQEIIIQLWRSFSNYDSQRRFSTWMYRIALNVAISFHRRESIRKHHVIADEQRLLLTASETESQPEEIRLLYHFIETLDPLNKALLLLYLDQHTYLEIAAILGITQSNVATKISRLKNKAIHELGNGSIRKEHK
jgi:RNA polymerase sigma factor (sigma-70 family)